MCRYHHQLSRAKKNGEVSLSSFLSPRNCEASSGIPILSLLIRKLSLDLDALSLYSRYLVLTLSISSASACQLEWDSPVYWHCPYKRCPLRSSSVAVSYSTTAPLVTSMVVSEDQGSSHRHLQHSATYRGEGNPYLPTSIITCPVDPAFSCCDLLNVLL